MAFAKAGVEDLSAPGIADDTKSLRAGLERDVETLLRQSRARATEDR